AGALRAVHAARIRMLDPGQDAQQGRLAHAVLADQSEALRGVGDERDVAEHAAIAVAVGDPVDAEMIGAGVLMRGGVLGHGGRPSRERAFPPGMCTRSSRAPNDARKSWLQSMGASGAGWKGRYSFIA